MLRALLLRHFSHPGQTALFRKVPENTALKGPASRAGFVPRPRLILLARIVFFGDARQHFGGLLRIFLEANPQASAPERVEELLNAEPLHLALAKYLA